MTWISRCSSMAWRPSASRASPSMWPIAFRHAAPLVHRGRHARPRAVHAQHGDRRLQLRCRGDSDRCAQGAADPDPPAQLHLLAAGDPAHIVVAVNKIDLVDFSGERFHHIVGDYLGFASRWISPRSRRSRCRRATATTSRSAPSGCAGMTGRVCSSIWRGVDIERSACRGAAVPLSGAVGEPAQPRFPRLLRHGRLRDRQTGRPCRRRRFRQGVDGRADRHRGRRSGRGRTPAMR
jgi:hypothetical protein